MAGGVKSEVRGRGAKVNVGRGSRYDRTPLVPGAVLETGAFPGHPHGLNLQTAPPQRRRVLLAGSSASGASGGSASTD